MYVIVNVSVTLRDASPAKMITDQVIFIIHLFWLLSVFFKLYFLHLSTLLFFIWLVIALVEADLFILWQKLTE